MVELRLKPLIAFLATAALAAACGGNNPDPKVVKGGGVADGDIDGTVHVYVIDNTSEAPIQGATVYLGSMMGTTDANGLYTFSGDLQGKQTITATASGYTSATFVGANGANVTIPMTSTSTATPPSATLSGSITGWAQMQPPPQAALIAYIGYSSNKNDGDPANSIQQPTTQPPPNVCFKITNQDCNWSLITRTGKVALYAFIGSATQTQQTITGFAYKTGLDVSAGVDQTGLNLDVAGASDLTTPTISTPSAPSGTTTVDALARLDLGDDGYFVFPLTGRIVTPVPNTSLFAGSSYQLIGSASSTTDAEAGSVVIQRNVTSLSGASLPAFQALPTGLSASATSFTYAPVSGAQVHTLDVHDANGNDAWTAIILDGSTTVALPSQVTLPSGTLTFDAQAIAAPSFDPQNFAIDDVKNTITATSKAGVTFTH